MRVSGIHHVSINVDDVPKAVEFYTEVLGFKLRGDRPDFGFEGAWLEVGGEQLHLISAPVPPSTGQHYAIQVDDIEVAIKEIRESGVVVSDAIPVNRNLQAFLTDPAGNQIELHQVGS